jgi:hypothetical protein
MQHRLYHNRWILQNRAHADYGWILTSVPTEAQL